jgi:hypothetical protein
LSHRDIHRFAEVGDNVSLKSATMGKLDVEGVLARNSWFASLPGELSESILHAECA